MMGKVIVVWLSLVYILFAVCYGHDSEVSNGEFVANLDEHCMQCLCQAATGCNLSLACHEGYCGPFRVTRVYWVDTGRLLNNPADEVDRNNAFEDCALHYECSTQMVSNYMIRYGDDCNRDGVTDCVDFMMLNYNGGYSCRRSLERDATGVKYLERFNNCWYP